MWELVLEQHRSNTGKHIAVVVRIESQHVTIGSNRHNERECRWVRVFDRLQTRLKTGVDFCW